MMRDAILNFPTQFEYQPKIENVQHLKKYPRYILVGMGGSHLSADLFLTYRPHFPLIAWRDYGLPPRPDKELKESLIIASSYSGNTEEVVEAYRQARKKKLPLVSIAVGGQLITMAKRDRTPYVRLPDTGIQPRSALAFSLRALLKVIGEDQALKQTDCLATVLKPAQLERTGKLLARKMKNHIPIIYCSRANETVAWNWKIKLNETGKVPAFYSVFPELNHNEMTGFDVRPTSAHLSRPFHFIILKDQADHPSVQKRMIVIERLYKKRKLSVTMIELTGSDIFEKIFTSLLIADWTALHTAALYDLESEQVPMVEEFKKLMRN